MSEKDRSNKAAQYIAEQSTERPNRDAQYIAEQRTVDVLRALREYSDETHPISKGKLLKYITTTSNPQTLSNTIDEILIQINPEEHNEENDGDYRIKYDGYDKPYDENPYIIKNKIAEIRKEMRRKDADVDAQCLPLPDQSYVFPWDRSG